MMKNDPFALRYRSHAEIPLSVAEYLCRVALVNSVYELNLFEINDYLDGLDDFYSLPEVA